MAAQATRPQTLAYGLVDSPIALLAWIIEKFKEWTDPAKELPEDAVDLDQLLANVSLYWFTESAGSAARLLYETTHAGGWPMPPRVPVGAAVFSADNTLSALANRGGGGHFSELIRVDISPRWKRRTCWFKTFEIFSAACTESKRRIAASLRTRYAGQGRSSGRISGTAAASSRVTIVAK